MADNQQLKDEILEFKQKITSKQQPHKPHIAKNKNMTFIYGFFADILAGVITAFVLYNIYQHFFSKNVAVLTILLIGCIAGGFYGTIKTFINTRQKK